MMTKVFQQSLCTVNDEEWSQSAHKAMPREVMQDLFMAHRAALEHAEVLMAFCLSAVQCHRLDQAAPDDGRPEAAHGFASSRPPLDKVCWKGKQGHSDPDPQESGQARWSQGEGRIFAHLSHGDLLDFNASEALTQAMIILDIQDLSRQF